MYLVLLLSVALVGLGAGRAAPIWSTLVQHEQEAELAFRLQEYRVAIARYRADHRRFPERLEELLLVTGPGQRKRYLRRLYPDPLTGRVDWALDLVVDRTGAASGIRNVHSRSTRTPLRFREGHATYAEW